MKSKSQIIAERIESEREYLSDRLNEKQAKRLAVLFSYACNMPCYDIQFKPVFRGRVKRLGNGMIRLTRRLGEASPDERTIRLFLDGDNVGVLLHELAHQKYAHHDETFWAFLITLYDIYEEKMKNEIFPVAPDPAEALEIAVTELIENAENNTVTMFEIGQKLLEYKINNQRNIEIVKSQLIDYGIKIRR